MRLVIRLYWLIPVLALVLFNFNQAPMARTNDEVLVLVNDTPITRQALETEMALLNAEMLRRNRSLSRNQMAGLSRQLVENLIDRELLYQRALEKNLEIRDRWVDRALADLKAELKNNARYKTYLKRAQMSESQLKIRIEKGLIVRRLLHRDVVRQIKVSEAEMQAFYRKHPEFFNRQEQVRVRQIMITVEDPGDASKKGQALLRIQSVENKIREGGNFASLALQYSEDSSKSKGGDLGYLERNEMIKPIADAAFSLKPGEVSDIIETRLGYHLIQVEDLIPSSPMAYRHARTKIERTLRRNKENYAAGVYLKRLKSQASIQRLAK